MPKEYKKLYFECESQEFLISRGRNNLSVAYKFLLGGFLNAGPYCSCFQVDERQVAINATET